MSSRNMPIDRTQIEQIHDYKYLGPEIKIEDNETCEIRQRLSLAWITLRKWRHILKRILPRCLKTNYSSRVSYLDLKQEHWLLQQGMVNMLRVTQRGIESLVQRFQSWIYMGGHMTRMEEDKEEQRDQERAEEVETGHPPDGVMMWGRSVFLEQGKIEAVRGGLRLVVGGTDSRLMMMT